jgi:hypothetical protein
VRCAAERRGLQQLRRIVSSSPRNETSLDQYQVRKCQAWYWHISLSMLAAAFLAVTAHTEISRKKGAPSPILVNSASRVQSFLD